ncbi:MAG: imidazole glycerol phosphate synthase subunit HisH [Candidatus Nanopelagicales bacterium]|nr:imidazole glycerol phosphate synthase subunit HisH [Candidatus Nanopelagicales bacterium]
MSKKIVVLDYGSGNIRSAQKSLQKIGANTEITNDYQTCLNADGLVVPGVGAFASCMTGINKVRGGEIIDKRLAGARNVLGICVGMQVLFENGLEHGENTTGLGQWPGEVTEIKSTVLPHMGWNNVEVAPGSTIFKGVEKEKFYFVHSFAAKNLTLEGTDKIDAPLKHFTLYGEKFLSCIENGSLSATQFHPEKSGEAGLQLLKNWLASV